MDTFVVKSRRKANMAQIHGANGIVEHIKYLEDENEMLNASLLALTTHLAQIQLRLHQITALEDASARDEVLGALKRFTFQGVDLSALGGGDRQPGPYYGECKRLMARLRSQVRQLERCLVEHCERRRRRRRRPDEPNYGGLVAQLQAQIGDLEHFVALLKKGQQCRCAKTEGGGGGVVGRLSMVGVVMMATLCAGVRRPAGDWGTLQRNFEAAAGRVRALLARFAAGGLPPAQMDREMTGAVQKSLAPSVRALVEHGVQHVALRIGCLWSRPHAWHVVRRFYDVNNGVGYQLDESFQLNMTPPALSCLLRTIRSVATSPTPTPDNNFATFLCLGLNTANLPHWFQAIFSSPSILEMYSSCSYVVQAGLGALLRIFDELIDANFCLPVSAAPPPPVRDAAFY